MGYKMIITFKDGTKIESEEVYRYDIVCERADKAWDLFPEVKRVNVEEIK